jgi:hypothetical protein
MPHDYSANLSAAQRNFLSVVPPPLPPIIQPVNATIVPQYHPSDMQGVSKCPGDYNQIPYGWRPSAFMGKCGYKIQLDKFYSADSPCFPVQDLSCMGPDQKKAWAFMCKTEFPCKPLAPYTFPKPYRSPPEWLRSSTNSRTNIGDDVLKVISDTILPALGVTAGCFLFASALASRESDQDSETESDTQSSEISKNN